MNDIVLNEIFETERELTELPVLASPEKQASIGISNLQQFKDKDGELFVKYKRNNAWEAHHLDKNSKSGEITNASKFNPSFIGTILKLVNPHLENKEIVRISATKNDKICDKYHSIAKKFIKRSGYTNYHVGELEDHPTEPDKKVFHIQPRMEEGVLMVMGENFVRELVEWSEQFDVDN